MLGFLVQKNLYFQRAPPAPNAGPHGVHPGNDRNVRRAELPAQEGSTDIPEANTGTTGRVPHSAGKLDHSGNWISLLNHHKKKRLLE